ncbi:hypothetical protein BTGOE6_24850 [Bacillus wiedmannii]|nr:hypothetical protein BTGOE6_24850 [Bacillus wiedmannii]
MKLVCYRYTAWKNSCIIYQFSVIERFQVDYKGEDMAKRVRILACMSNILIELSYLLAYFIGEIVILILYLNDIWVVSINYIKRYYAMKFEDKRMLGIQLGSLVLTKENQYLVIKKNDNYSLVNINNLECVLFEVPLEHVEEMVIEDLKESIQEIVAPEHIKLVAKNIL